MPAGNDQLLVSEKSGVVRLVAHGRVRPVPFLDLEAAISDARPEQGLLSIALHPDFAANGRFFIQFTDGNGDSRRVEYRRSTDKPNQADPRSARLVMAVDQPGQFHNGGMVEFGPDGYLYVGMGDGGFGRPDRNGDELTNTLGSILRIDVDGAHPYSAPAANPYVDSPLASEIWLNGVLNPWRFFIDPITRQIVTGDAGQFSWEEVTVVPLDTGGLDLGWPRLEGESCYEVSECSTLGLTMPGLVYSQLWLRSDWWSHIPGLADSRIGRHGALCRLLPGLGARLCVVRRPRSRAVRTGGAGRLRSHPLVGTRQGWRGVVAHRVGRSQEAPAGSTSVVRHPTGICSGVMPST